MKTRLTIAIILLTIICNGCHENISHENKAEPVPKIIGIQPFGDFDIQLADTVCKQIASAYGMKTKVFPSIPLPENAFTSLRSPRYRADSLIRHLRTIKPKEITILMGLTNQDISITKRDTTGNIKEPKSKYIDFGIFGLGFQPGSASVVSIYRYQTGNKAIFYDRFFKICKHEIGHNLGLPHCPNRTCVMQDAAESIVTIDHAGPFLCESCNAKINLSFSQRP